MAKQLKHLQNLSISKSMPMSRIVNATLVNMPIRHLNHRNLVERDANVLYPKYPLSSDIQSWIESNSDLASYESGDNDSMKQSFTHDAAIIKQSTAAWDIPPTVQKRRRGQRNSNLSSHNLPSKRQKLLPISGNAMPPQPSSPAKGTRSQSKQKANVETENQGTSSSRFPFIIYTLLCAQVSIST